MRRSCRETTFDRLERLLMPLKIAANLTMMFGEHEFMDRFSAAARNGFKGVEYLFPYDYPAEAIREQLDANGLKQVLFDFPAGDWAAGDRGIAVQPDRVGEFQDGVGKAVEYAQVLGCERLTCLAGIPQEGTDPETAERTMVRNLQFAADAAAGIGAIVLVEPLNTRDVPGTFVSTSAHGARLVRDTVRDNVRLQFDVYHTQIMEGDIAMTFSDHLPMIGHVQIADNPGRHEPGTGEINYPFVFNHITNSGYDGWIGAEYMPAQDTESGLAWASQYL